MTATLFVKANNRPSDQSVSVRLYDAFLNSYRESHPNEPMVELDLYAERLPYLGADMIHANYKSAQKIALTLKEKTLSDIANKHLQQFIAADKVVIAFPLWNLTVPAVLHTYLDYMHRPGQTFKYTEEGHVGLLSDKKVALLNARGGVYPEGDPGEMAVSFVQNQLRFFGITDIQTVIVEGHHQFPERSEAIIAAGINKAREVAKTF
ncbi:FMN-dependent NADH-azoreductase [Desmospora activa]|uniref:FMN dependent NADH:quinone oxidoreductase n=1 Tax=Desmospora activa DSM 45169 TaxID=1121389 RepID=A0A2T4ZA05_9BACL|nr:FMN-dependent NADH-azoreductase [Desmospora activa]PTM58714.1 FMN-dependent NADH-azoreductase [Desmospora activa DSM 45169]